MSRRCALSVQGRVVLSIQDTPDINLYNHRNRIQANGAIGPTASKCGLGFLIHPSLVVDAGNCFPYGFSNIRLWNRPLENKTKFERKYQSLPIEEKESYKWLISSEHTKSSLQEAAMVIIIQDREGDIYEQFATIPDEKTHLLIRSSTNRNVAGNKKLFESLAECALAGTYSIPISGDKRKNQLKREALIEVRFSEVEIKKNALLSKDLPEKIKLYAVEAKEVNSQAENPVCWRLLTTVPVSTFEEALLVIEWYSWRWIIEELFRILKEEGFNIEASELENGWSIRKLSLLMLDTIIKLFQMRIAYETPEDEGLPASVCFTEEEEGCLASLTNKLEGKTQKQKNLYKPNSLQSATWVIARLGGWKGYASERPPGITTLWIGLRKFYDTFSG